MRAKYWARISDIEYNIMVVLVILITKVTDLTNGKIESRFGCLLSEGK
jgi:hypothetical protein